MEFSFGSVKHNVTKHVKIKSFAQLTRKYENKLISYTETFNTKEYKNDLSNTFPDDECSFLAGKGFYEKQNLRNVSIVLALVIENLPRLENGEKYKIIDVGAGIGDYTKYLVSKINHKIVLKWISTDAFHQGGNFSSVVDLDFFKNEEKPDFSYGLKKSKQKNLKQEQEHSIVIANRKEKWLKDTKLKQNKIIEKYKSRGLFPSPIPVIFAKMNAFEVVNKISAENIDNSILFLACPNPTSSISTDLILLMETINVDQVKYIIMIRTSGNQSRLDGTPTFFDDFKTLKQNSIWNIVFHKKQITTYDVSFRNYYRDLFVFSKTNKQIHLNNIISS